MVTNIEADHLDYYGTLRRRSGSAFERFVAGARRHRVVSGDDPVAADIGRADGADRWAGTGLHLRIVDRRAGPQLDLVRVVGPGEHRAGPVGGAGPRPPQRPERRRGHGRRPGRRHPFASAARALARFAGVARRFEFRGTLNGVTFVDDYAHLPTEVRAALAAARNGAWDRVVAVFQPHRYSRTAALGAAFGAAFVDADVVVVTDVYGAGEAPVPGVTGQLVADAVRRSPRQPGRYVPSRIDARAYLGGVLRPATSAAPSGPAT